MKRMISAAIAAVILLSLADTAFAGGGEKAKFSFKNEPFEFWQCYATGDFFPGPAETFGEDVCVFYQALNKENVTVEANGDVSWILQQKGTATIYAQDDQEILFEGNFKVEEIARDIGGDAECLWVDGEHAWIGICKHLFTGLDFLEYHWKIQGASVYYFDATIRSPGAWCYSSKQGGAIGPGCK